MKTENISADVKFDCERLRELVDFLLVGVVSSSDSAAEANAEPSAELSGTSSIEARILLRMFVCLGPGDIMEGGLCDMAWSV